MNQTSALRGRYTGDWPDLRSQIRAEARLFLDLVDDPELLAAPSACAGWDGRDVVIHLAETFDRFHRMLMQSRDGDLSPPFERGDLDAVNDLAVADFDGDPLVSLRAAIDRWCDDIDDPHEVIAHQIGPIPVGLQSSFGLGDLVLHHDDVLFSAEMRYQPAVAVADIIANAWSRAFAIPGLLAAPDAWSALLDRTKRRPTGTNSSLA
jgi:hypothetical protein